MAIISFDKDALVDFVPEYGKNRGSENPCVVRLRFVPFKRIQHYRQLMDARNKGVLDPGKITENSQTVQRQQFIESVDLVSGYFVGDREVGDPGEFYDTADADLVVEILLAMISNEKLSEGQRKNS